MSDIFNVVARSLESGGTILIESVQVEQIIWSRRPKLKWFARTELRKTQSHVTQFFPPIARFSADSRIHLESAFIQSGIIVPAREEASLLITRTKLQLGATRKWYPFNWCSSVGIYLYADTCSKKRRKTASHRRKKRHTTFTDWYIGALNRRLKISGAASKQQLRFVMNLNLVETLAD